MATRFWPQLSSRLQPNSPTPVQMARLAYPGGTDLDPMDYRITDGFMDPEGRETPFYAEESIRSGITRNPQFEIIDRDLCLEKPFWLLTMRRT
jgi:hypothetical protein